LRQSKESESGELDGMMGKLLQGLMGGGSGGIESLLGGMGGGSGGIESLIGGSNNQVNSGSLS
jgi:hypothetical protein